MASSFGAVQNELKTLDARLWGCTSHVWTVSNIAHLILSDVFTQHPPSPLSASFMGEGARCPTSGAPSQLGLGGSALTRYHSFSPRLRSTCTSPDSLQTARMSGELWPNDRRPSRKIFCPQHAADGWGEPLRLPPGDLSRFLSLQTRLPSHEMKNLKDGQQNSPYHPRLTQGPSEFGAAKSHRQGSEKLSDPLFGVRTKLSDPACSTLAPARPASLVGQLRAQKPFRPVSPCAAFVW
ncbi:hypothetical protein QBC46DRAFT_450561 [Diplogelasinospora grovesii]|uniref:Uncharacterized protein n=1 Tax=Diplogelasinospora grovesii TaxID=303347 RepID=A0AAN6N6L9_9PEZI|nr:hypothetical protein QBC46DRAFT_450561 [Diplogelasinospora grovesii]